MIDPLFEAYKELIQTSSICEAKNWDNPIVAYDPNTFKVLKVFGKSQERVLMKLSNERVREGKDTAGTDLKLFIERFKNSRPDMIDQLKKIKFRGSKEYEPLLNESETLTEANTLTPEQKEEIKAEMVPMGKGSPVRFKKDGGTLNISTGEITKGGNVINQVAYWNFTKDTSKKIAKMLGARAVF